MFRFTDWKHVADVIDADKTLVFISEGVLQDWDLWEEAAVNERASREGKRSSCLWALFSKHGRGFRGRSLLSYVEYIPAECRFTFSRSWTCSPQRFWSDSIWSALVTDSINAQHQDCQCSYNRCKNGSTIWSVMLNSIFVVQSFFDRPALCKFYHQLDIWLGESGESLSSAGNCDRNHRAGQENDRFPHVSPSGVAIFHLRLCYIY